MSAQTRLEALKLAVQSGLESSDILVLAEEYANFIEGSATVVKINQTPPETEVNSTQTVTPSENLQQQRRSRKGRR